MCYLLYAAIEAILQDASVLQAAGTLSLSVLAAAPLSGTSVPSAPCLSYGVMQATRSESVEHYLIVRGVQATPSDHSPLQHRDRL